MHKIGIVGLSSLETIAIRKILEDYSGIHTESYVSFNNLHEIGDMFDMFFVSCDIIMRNLDFFLPRKNRVVAISHEFGNENNSFVTIGRDSDLTEIISVIDKSIGEWKCREDNGELTMREIEVLKELVSGLTIKEIADRLFISPSTVITHRKNISSKLGIRSVSGLSLYALMNGIV